MRIYLCPNVLGVRGRSKSEYGTWEQAIAAARYVVRAGSSRKLWGDCQVQQ